jgi:hypothetical protein
MNGQRIAKSFGWLALAAVVITGLAFFPDLRRYLRIERM